MARMIGETKTFLLTIALPALFVAAGGAWLLVAGWRQMWDDERKDLDAQAELIAHAVMGRAFDDRASGSRAPPRRFPPRPPDMPKRAWRRAVSESFARTCADYRAETAATGVAAFEVRDADGTLIYAARDFPSDPPAIGVCVLGPPLGDGELHTARTDGGAAMFRRSVCIVALGGILVLLVIALLLAGGAFFLHAIRRERRESRMKTDVIDNVSHELRTPLAGIRLNAELLAEDRIRDETRRRGALASILTESDRLERMVAGLLDFGRLEKGTRRYSLETFNLAEFASGVAEAEGAASISGGRARLSVKGPGALVTADKDALRQIGVNLVTNAAKYSSDEITIEVEGNEVRFMDRGPGIPPGCEERIFERFYRVDNSLARRVNGSGLGLSIARALARGMGGDLNYAHRPGGGSVFTLSLAPAGACKGGLET